MSALLSPEDLKRQALANVQDATESNAENPALAALRDSSLAALKAAVFPGRKTEQWKYTSLQPLADGHLSKRERKFLKRAAERMGVDKRQVERTVKSLRKKLYRNSRAAMRIDFDLDDLDFD